MLIDSGLNILDIIFVLALMFFALWKKGWIRIVLSLCIIIWGVFAMSYDIKVAAPLIGIGAVLFFMAAMKLIDQARQDREEEA